MLSCARISALYRVWLTSLTACFPLLLSSNSLQHVMSASSHKLAASWKCFMEPMYCSYHPNLFAAHDHQFTTLTNYSRWQNSHSADIEKAPGHKWNNLSDEPLLANSLAHSKTLRILNLTRWWLCLKYRWRLAARLKQDLSMPDACLRMWHYGPQSR